ncbi:MAG: sensor histidine kinase, partial [Acidobacteria bacterium]|nr:sensor histidine kinase [Acidobacteriota bacterium]
VGRTEKVGWPADMAELRRVLADREALTPARRDNAGSGGGLLPVMSTESGQPLLIFQLVDTPTFPAPWNERDRGNQGQLSQRAAGVVIVSINLPYLQQDLLPGLAKHHFVDGDRKHFDLAIASSDRTDRTIWLSEAVESRAGSPGWNFSESDLSMRLFTLRSDLLRQQLRRWRPAQDSQPPAPGAPRLAIVGGRLVFSDELPSLWNLHLRHHSGSLDVAVANARRTNLGISLAILSLLTASFLLMMVSSIRARRLAREQMDFVAGVSHELRTPLAVIDSAGYNLSRGFVSRPEATREYGQMIRNECHRLGEMVEQVLDFATFRSGRQVFNQQPVALTDIVEESVRASQPLLDEGGFKVEQQISPRLPDDPEWNLVMADRQAMIRALRNLLSNAMKYGGEDRWIGLKVTPVRRGRSEFVNLTISDHGRGIPREDLSRIFEPFYRSSDVRTAQIQGNGLGLSLVRNIVEAHHGTISVESQAGRGTSFTISLPVATPPALADAVSLLAGTEVTTR